MTHDEVLALIDALDPENDRDLTAAIEHIRLVVGNNTKTAIATLNARPDIQEALGIIDAWVERASTALDESSRLIPGAADVVRQGEETLDGFISDTDPERRDTWKDQSEDPQSWAAKIILRMSWFRDWLRRQVESSNLATPYKRWVSRLDPKTCRYCRALHDTVIPVGESFVAAATAAGFRRIYGGLFAPPLHPRCRCRLVGVNQAEYDRLNLSQATAA